MRILRSQVGFVITEIMVSIVIAGILMASAATGFVIFFSKFEDLNQAVEIQRDAFNCLQTIKNGIPIGSGLNLKFSGVATADSVRFVNSLNNDSSDNIVLYPGSSNIQHVNDYVNIYYNHYAKAVWATYLDGSFQPSPKQIFPAVTRKRSVEVTKLLFTQANTGESVARVLNVQLEARVLMKNKKYKSISYTTRMALAPK